jgi:adenylosuccinate lyase
MVLRSTQVLKHLVFFETNIERNLNMNPAIFMEKKMVELITKEGLGRQEAYRKAKTTFSDTIPSDYIGLSQKIVARVIKKLANDQN